MNSVGFSGQANSPPTHHRWNTSYCREADRAALASVVPAIPGIVLPHVLDKMNLLKVLWSGRT